MSESEPTLSTSALETCVFCPHLCRHVCPVAVASGRESAAPATMATGVWSWLHGRTEASWAAAHASLCVDCGRCRDHCKHHRPLDDLLRQARSSTALPPFVEPPGLVDGDGELVAIETDDRRWAGALSRQLGKPVACYRAPDHLGAPLLDHPTRFERYARALRDRLSGRVLVVSDTDSQRAAEAAGLVARPLQDLVELELEGVRAPDCRGREPMPDAAPGCCGARRHLRDAHPQIAGELAADFIARLEAGQPGRTIACVDGHCAEWLREHGATVRDPIDALLRLDAPPESP